MLRCLLTCVVALLGLCAGVSAQEPAAAEPADDTVCGAKVTWIAPQEPGLPACVRVRGDALNALLNAGDAWHLSCGDEVIPAYLRFPEPLAPAQRHGLELLWQKETADGALQVLLDRGASPPEIDRLGLFFAAVDVRCAVQVEYSADREEFTPAARHQAVAQQLGAGVLRLTTITVAPAEKRYLRLTMPGAADARLDRAEGWAEPAIPWQMYQVEAGVGPMYDAVPPGEHVWPLLLPENGLPLAKLKVIADAPGRLRHLRVVRTGIDGQPRTTVAEAFWADRIQVRTGETSLTRSEKWVILPGESGGEGGWAVVVEDGDEDALQVTDIQAYAAEVALCFTVPEQSGPVELWLEPAARPDPAGIADAPAVSRITGEVTRLGLSRERSLASATSTVTHDWQVGITDAWMRWHKPVYWLTAALVALWFALYFLQRREPDGLPDN